MRRSLSSDVYWFELEMVPGWGPIFGIASPFVAVDGPLFEVVIGAVEML
jgi:hypothetical protein